MMRLWVIGILALLWPAHLLAQLIDLSGYELVDLTHAYEFLQFSQDFISASHSPGSSLLSLGGSSFGLVSDLIGLSGSEIAHSRRATSKIR